MNRERPSDHDALKDLLQAGDPAKDRALEPRQIAALRQSIVNRAETRSQRASTPWMVSLRWATLALCVLLIGWLAVVLGEPSQNPPANGTASPSLRVQTAAVEPPLPDTAQRNDPGKPEPAEIAQGTSVESLPEASAGNPEASGAGSAAKPPPSPNHREAQPPQPAEVRLAASAPGSSMLDSSHGPPASQSRQIRFEGPRGTQVIWTVGPQTIDR